MEENKITNRHVGVPKGWSSNEKFRNVRDKSERDQNARKQAAKKKKVPFAEYAIGDRVVLTNAFGHSGIKSDFVYAEIIDVSESDWDKIVYFAVVLKANHFKWEKRLGHLIQFGATSSSFMSSFNLVVKPVPPESVKWAVWLPEEVA